MIFPVVLIDCKVRPELQLARTDLWRRGMNQSPAEIVEIIADLRSQHRDLDDAIARLAESPTMNQLQLTRLKKRKLRMKDQIAWWESKLIPDLDA